MKPPLGASALIIFLVANAIPTKTSTNALGPAFDEALQRLRANDSTLTTLIFGAMVLENSVAQLLQTLNEFFVNDTQSWGQWSWSKRGCGLADALQTNSSLTTLNIAYNELGEVGVQLLQMLYQPIR